MHAVAIVLAASALTVDYGWEKSGDGELEYIIQIEPPLLEVLKAGGTITSEIDPQVAQVRRFRVRVGHGPVPRELPSTAIDAAGARPIDGPNPSALRALDPLTLQPGMDDEAMEPSPPAWSAGSVAQTEETEPRDDPSLDLAPDLLNPTERAIQQPNQTNRLAGPLDVGPSSDLRPGPSDADATEAADRQFSPLPPWDSKTPGANDASHETNDADRFGPEASRWYPDDDVQAVARPAQHDAPTDPYAPDSAPFQAQDRQDSVSEVNDSHAASPGWNDPYGDRPEQPTVYDQSVQNVAAGEDVSSRSNERGLIEPIEQPLRVASTNPTKSPPSESTQTDPASAGTTHRWLPFLFTLVALFASCGLNVYLGWITWDTYHRYQRLVADMHRSESRGVTT